MGHLGSSRPPSTYQAGVGGQEQRPRRSGQDFGRLRDWTRLVGLVGYALGAGSSQGVAVANRRSRSLVEERSGGLEARKGVLSSPGRTSELIRPSPVENRRCRLASLRKIDEIFGTTGEIRERM